MTRNARSLGRAWELRAAEFLRSQGLDILLHGYQCRLGEIDLVAADDTVLVIVEVRARSHASFGTAVETIGARKQSRIVRATRHLLMQHPDWSSRTIRFDVVAIDGIASPDPVFTWIRHAFEAA